MIYATHFTRAIIQRNPSVSTAGFRLFKVNNGVELTLENILISNHDAEMVSVISVEGSLLPINSSTINGNTAVNGDMPYAYTAARRDLLIAPFQETPRLETR